MYFSLNEVSTSFKHELHEIQSISINTNLSKTEQTHLQNHSSSSNHISFTTIPSKTRNLLVSQHKTFSIISHPCLNKTSNHHGLRVLPRYNTKLVISFSQITHFLNHSRNHRLIRSCSSLRHFRVSLDHCVPRHYTCLQTVPSQLIWWPKAH